MIKDGVLLNKDMTVREWLGKDNDLGSNICERKYIRPDESFTEMVYRICGGNEDAMRLVFERKFLPAGRTITNRGTSLSASLSNCYSSGYAEDDYEKILDLNTKIGLTYKYQGGQGISLSKLRPKDAPICGGEYQSDGIVPFMELFNQTTLSTSQGGSRKSALMMSLDCWHKEIEDFIHIKAKDGAIEAANLSVEIDDEFMGAIKKYFDSGAIVEKTITRQYGKNNEPVTYTITPIEVYHAMMRRAYDWGDPGCIFTEQFRSHNMMQCCDEYMVVTGNPCGEQPLATNAACNLGSINLSEFVLDPFLDSAKFDIDGLLNAVRIAVEVLDDIVTEGIDRHPLEEQREQARLYRNIGLGFMGLADALIKLKIVYGSDESVQFVDDITSAMFKTAVTKSYELACTRGAFPAYREELFDSDIMKDHFNDDELNAMKKNGLRNCSLLSIAPTGSIGTMLNVSTGIEPFFEFAYQRETKSVGAKVYDVEAKIVKEYRAVQGDGDIPSYFVSSCDIPWKSRINVQAAAQRHIDTAISSTVNLPQDTSLEDVEKLYLYAWQSKLKGITIFRSGCKKAAILTTKKDCDVICTTSNKLGRGDIVQCSDDLVGKKRKLTTGCGTIHCQAWFDPVTGDLMETFIPKGGTGGCRCNGDAVSRLISLASRGGICIESVVDQLSSCDGCGAYRTRTATKHDTSKGSSCPTACAYAILDMHNEVLGDLGLTEATIARPNAAVSEAKRESKTVPKEKSNQCPECGESLIFEGGCNICKECGWSKCG